MVVWRDAGKCVKITQLCGGGYDGASTASVTLASGGAQQVEEGKRRQEEQRPKAAAECQVN